MQILIPQAFTITCITCKWTEPYLHIIRYIILSIFYLPTLVNEWNSLLYISEINIYVCLHTADTMARASFALLHQDFLIRLGEASKRDRKQMCQNITNDQLEGMSEVARCVRRRKIAVYRRDRTKFKDEDILLRIVASPDQPDGRKRHHLILRHRILPRLLRRCYIRRTIGYITRSG